MTGAPTGHPCQPVGVSPFLRPDAPDIDEMLADGAVAVLTERGVDGLNVAALARWMRTSKQSLSQRLSGPGGARRRILHLATHAFGRRWMSWVESALLEDPPVPALPATDDEIVGVRVWGALAELARGEEAGGDPDLAGVIAKVRSRERELTRHRVSEWMRAYPAEDDLTELCALVDGLRLALAAPVPDLALDVARRLAVRRLGAVRAAAPL